MDSVTPGPLGRNQRSARIKSYVGLVLRLVGEKFEMILKGIRAEVVKAGVFADIGTLSHFSDRRQMTWGKSSHPEKVREGQRWSP